jgi:hypothetical protein
MYAGNAEIFKAGLSTENLGMWWSCVVVGYVVLLKLGAYTVVCITLTGVTISLFMGGGGALYIVHCMTQLL